MKGARSLVLITAAALLVGGCGTAFRAGESWDPKEARFFDDGIDLISEPSKLAGEWSYRNEEELDARVNLADLIALVEIGTVQTNQDIEGVEAKRIQTTVTDVLYGETPTDAIALRSSKTSMGYPLIIRHERHLTGTLLLFLRWFENDKGVLDHHFHLSPASGELMTSVGKKIDRRKAEEEAAMMSKQR